MSNDNNSDMKILCNQYDYLKNALIFHKPYSYNSHTHCELCFRTIDKTTQKLSFCTLDERLWICEDCFQKYYEVFNWYVFDEQGEQICVKADIQNGEQLLDIIKKESDGGSQKYLWIFGYEKNGTAVLFGTNEESRKTEIEACIALWAAENKLPIDWIACYEPNKSVPLSFYLARMLPTLNVQNLKARVLFTNPAGNCFNHQLGDYLPREMKERMKQENTK